MAETNVETILKEVERVMLDRAYCGNPTDDPALANAQIAETWVKQTVKEIRLRLDLSE